MDEQRAARLHALKQHPSWPELVAAIDEQVEKYRDGLGHLLMSGNGLPDNFEYKRGFLAGMKAVARYPETAERALERALAKSKQEGDA